MASGASSRLSRRRVVAGLSSLVAVASVGGIAKDYTRDSTGSEQPAIVGHRGAAGLAPPNTLAGIRRALEHDVDGVELDVRRTADGTLVLFHDPILDWATTGRGRVHETPWEGIAETRIGGEPIPTLDDGLEALADSDADVQLFLEAKRVGYTESLVSAVEEYGLLDRLTVTSFKPDALAPAMDRGIPTGLLGVAPNPELLEAAVAVGATSVSPHYVPSTYSWFLEEAHENGLTAGIWHLVEIEQSLEASRNTNPDFITTNRPDLAVPMLRT